MKVRDYMNLPYTMTVQWDGDDELFVARVREIEGCTGHGETAAAAIEMLTDNMQEWISLCLEGGESVPVPADNVPLPSGRFLQRVPKSLHKQLILRAQEEGVSLNTYVTTCLAISVTKWTGSVAVPESSVPVLEARALSVERGSAMLFQQTRVQNVSWGQPIKSQTQKSQTQRRGQGNIIFLKAMSGQLPEHHLEFDKVRCDAAKDSKALAYA